MAVHDLNNATSLLAIFISRHVFHYALQLADKRVFNHVSNLLSIEWYGIMDGSPTLVLLKFLSAMRYIK